MGVVPTFTDTTPIFFLVFMHALRQFTGTRSLFPWLILAIGSIGGIPRPFLVLIRRSVLAILLVSSLLATILGYMSFFLAVPTDGPSKEPRTSFGLLDPSTVFDMSTVLLVSQIEQGLETQCSSSM